MKRGRRRWRRADRRALPSGGRQRRADGQKRVDERAQVQPVAADPPRLDLHHLSRVGPTAVGIDPEPAGTTDRPWTWTAQPDLVTGSIESAANAMIVSSSARSGSAWCPGHTASLPPSR
jgi:hypothetical protein